jgi:hypothetical protein
MVQLRTSAVVAADRLVVGLQCTAVSTCLHHGTAGLAVITVSPISCAQALCARGVLLLQVALAIKLEGDARHSEGAASAELLAVAADVWAHSIRPMHREQESYHEGQVHPMLIW